MFRFKQFEVDDTHSSMKVGTDAVLLGAWVPIGNYNSILDIGTGCGVIALMMAQRFCNATIHAIDIDENACKDANANFANSIWNDRLTIYNHSIQQYSRNLFHCYDLIVSNPPFFNNSLKSISSARNLARHTDSLSFDDLLLSVQKALSQEGIFCGILPYEEACFFIQKAFKYGLYCMKKTVIYNTFTKPPKRILFSLSRNQFEKKEDTNLSIRKEENMYSEEYLALTKDFYLFTSEEM